MDLNSKIEKLRALAITAKASIYNEEAMTALELAGATACKVNQCVECVNGMLDLLTEISADLEKHMGEITYNAENEEIIL